MSHILKNFKMSLKRSVKNIKKHLAKILTRTHHNKSKKSLKSKGSILRPQTNTSSNSLVGPVTTSQSYYYNTEDSANCLGPMSNLSSNKQTLVEGYMVDSIRQDVRAFLRGILRELQQVGSRPQTQISKTYQTELRKAVRFVKGLLQVLEWLS